MEHMVHHLSAKVPGVVLPADCIVGISGGCTVGHCPFSMLGYLWIRVINTPVGPCMSPDLGSEVLDLLLVDNFSKKVLQEDSHAVSGTGITLTTVLEQVLIIRQVLLEGVHVLLACLVQAFIHEAHLSWPMTLECLGVDSLDYPQTSLTGGSFELFHRASGGC